jgi:hypothetical protein
MCSSRPEPNKRNDEHDVDNRDVRDMLRRLADQQVSLLKRTFMDLPSDRLSHNCHKHWNSGSLSEPRAEKQETSTVFKLLLSQEDYQDRQDTDFGLDLIRRMDEDFHNVERTATNGFLLPFFALPNFIFGDDQDVSHALVSERMHDIDNASMTKSMEQPPCATTETEHDMYDSFLRSHGARDMTVPPEPNNQSLLQSTHQAQPFVVSSQDWPESDPIMKDVVTESTMTETITNLDGAVRTRTVNKKILRNGQEIVRENVSHSRNAIERNAGKSKILEQLTANRQHREFEDDRKSERSFEDSYSGSVSKELTRAVDKPKQKSGWFWAS